MAPFDKSLWMNVGMMQAEEGQIALAKFSLQPLANDPHGGGSAAAAKALIALLDSAPEGEPFRVGNMRELVAGSGEESDGEEGDGEEDGA